MLRPTPSQTVSVTEHDRIAVADAAMHHVVRLNRDSIAKDLHDRLFLEVCVHFLFPYPPLWFGETSCWGRQPISLSESIPIKLPDIELHFEAMPFPYC